ncbi:endonuclease [uncultured Chryseobacterium sp.]|uniref:endonuclease n=1 Tax=uncultured Chryseobacterium sp. TaxID=259322 RepID=UPI0026148CA7|nr:endonuclease [uncultured Chryseobacterium sp.]
MKKGLSFLFSFLAIIIFGQTAPAYYNGLDFSKTGNAMKDQLAALITTTHTTEIPYGSDTNDVLIQSDADPTIPGNILLIYGSSNTNDKYQRSRSASGSWNKEHVYARSLGTPNLGSTGPGADIHHLRPSDITLNSDRGNLIFTDGTGSIARNIGGAWFPGDEWKGDVARMMMYMYVRYNTRAQAINVGTTPMTYSPDMPDIFLKWNVEDPVSDFEKQRNNVVYSYQGNRNPFIDNPYLATVIWNGPAAQNTWPGNFSTDTEAPTSPANLAVSTTTDSTVSLSWTASNDNVGVTGYEVYVDGTLYATTTSTNLVVSGLLASTTYNFYVIAKDAAGNKSVATATVQGTTTASTDTTPPSAPLNLTVGNTTSSTVALSWSASTDNVGVIGYDIYVNGVLNSSVSGTNATVSGLNPSTTYNFYVVAKDAANNKSAASSTIQGTTSAISTLCGDEDFESIPTSSSSYSTRTWTNNAVTWTATDARTDETIDSKAITIRNGSLTSSSVANGIGSLTVTTQLKYSGSASVFNLLINGVKKGTIAYSSTVGTFTINDINVVGNVTVSLVNTSTTNRVAIDNLTWTCYIPLATSEANLAENKLKVYPNPVKNQELTISGLEKSTATDVQIYSMNGQLVQTIDDVKDKQKLILKKLPKGIYILKAGKQTAKIIVE